MLKKPFRKAITIILSLLLFCLPLSAQANSLTEPTSTGIAREQVIPFEDTNEFYQKLALNLKSGNTIKITTPYTQYSDFPDKLKEFLNISPDDLYLINSPQNINARSNNPFALYAPINGNSLVEGTFFPNMAVLTTSFAVGGAAIGTGLGSVAGGIGALPGAIIGAGIGFCTGTLVSILMESKYEFIIIFNPKKGITIVIKPSQK